MQFVSKMRNFQCLLALMAFLVGASNALLCTICLDPFYCLNAPATLECTVELVTEHHNLLLAHNPSLQVQESDTFKCYDLDLSYQNSSTVVVQKGCTYNTTNFCVGWNNTATIARCETCDSGDDCNKGPSEGTTTPVNNSSSTATTNTVETTSTAVTDNSTTSSVSVTASTTTAASNTTSVPVNSTTASTATAASSTTSASGTSTTTAASNTTSAPVNSTTVSTSVTATTMTAGPSSTSAAPNSTPASSPVTTAGPTSTTVETTTAAATNLGCIINWYTLAGYALLHGLIVRRGTVI